MYFQAVFELESVRLRTDTSIYAGKLVEQQRQILAYFDEHQVKVQYYRCGFTHLDEKYFLRDEGEIPVQLRNHISLLDEQFFTWHDHTFSLIKAYDLLLDYIAHEILKYAPGEQLNAFPQKSKLRWTGSKVDLVELIYAIHASGEVNDGYVKIAELTRAFECVITSYSIHYTKLYEREAVAETIVRTPEKASGLKVWLDESGRKAKAGCNDVLFLYVAAVDENGTITPDFNGAVSIEADEHFEVMNKDDIKAEAGIATALIRILDTAGNASVTVKSEGLKSGEFSFVIGK